MICGYGTVDALSSRRSNKPRGCLHGIKVFFSSIVAVALVIVLGACAANGYVCLSVQSSVKSSQEVVGQRADLDAQAIVVLGAGINFDGSPSSILKDRLDTAIDLYDRGVAPKIIMSGDNSDASYNEVMAMCNYAVSQGVSRHDVFCDHAGTSTYDSMYRLRYVFGVDRCVVVTQNYHLYRSLFDARGFGITAQGVASDLRTYEGMDSYERREFFARIKDCFQVLTKTEPEVKSSPVSLDQSGTVTQWW